MLEDAAGDYESVFKACKTPYSGVNAASSFAMAGDMAMAGRIAGTVEELAAKALSDLDEDEEAYWLRTSLAECALLKGDMKSAAGLFRQACAASDVTAGKKATTRRQLIRLRDNLPIDMGWIDAAAPQGRAGFFAGAISRDSAADASALDEVKQAAKDWARRERIEWACGALAAGADIAIAEALLEEGAQLHVCLPLEPGAFFKASIAPFGAEWPDRFAACMRAATAIEWNARAMPMGAAYELGALSAMGKTLRQAQALETTPDAFFALAEPNADTPPSLTDVLLERWRAQGYAYDSRQAKWAARPKTTDQDDSTVIYALIAEFSQSASNEADTVFETLHKLIEQTGPVAAPVATVAFSGPHKGRDSKGRDNHGGAFLFKSADQAIAAAHSVTDHAISSGLKTWLDVGVFAKDALQDLSDIAALRGHFLTASCRPATALGKTYASDIFANAAALAAPISAFNYVGYASGQEKIDPCPLYLLGQ